jgi:RNA polymerase sigma-70 factor (ECF subfamily)
MVYLNIDKKYLFLGCNISGFSNVYIVEGVDDSESYGGHIMYHQSQSHAIYRPNDISSTYVEQNTHALTDSFKIEEFVYKHENKIYRTALAIMGNTADAEDVMQEVFLKVITESQKKDFGFNSDEHEEAWLTRVTVNQCKNVLRMNKWRRTISLEEIAETHGACDEKSKLLESINVLPSKQRIAIYLYYYEGYSTKEIAEITHQTDTTVRSHLARARKKLKDLLTDSETD